MDLLGSSKIWHFNQSGRVRIFKGGWIRNCTSFENPTQARSLFYTLEVTRFVRETECTHFSKAHPYVQHICKFQQSWNNINNITSVQLFIKSLFRHLDNINKITSVQLFIKSLFRHLDNINNITSVQLFIKSLFRHLDNINNITSVHLFIKSLFRHLDNINKIASV